MSNTTQTNPWLLLRRIFAHEMSAKDRQMYENQLNKFFANTVQALFEQFADARVNQLNKSEADKAKSKETIIDETLKRLKAAVVEGITDELKKITTSYPSYSPSKDAAKIVMDYYITKNIQLYYSFSLFLQELEQAFPQNKNALLAMINGDYKKSGSPVPAAIVDLIKIFANKFQDLTIKAPSFFYPSSTISTDAEESLVNTLRIIDRIRYKYSLVGKAIIPSLDHALRELNRKIAHEERRIWLPFKPLVMAPLASQEDFELYARDQKEVETFANRIGGSDGVFLITGYRGVGKSTFIYEALSLLAQRQKYKRDDNSWHVVPISISLAKASSITNILRLCVRRLFDTFLSETAEQSDAMSSLTQGVSKLLTEGEKEHLRLAYLRATWKVNIQRDDSVKALRQMGLDANMNIKSSDFFASKLGNMVAGTFPSFGINGKMSKEWSKAMGSTVALPDYDEDKAEDDIVQFIRMLATPNRTRNNSRIRLVFIFDEIDKMEDNDQETLIKQLKNLFLEKHSAFLLVTSKSFYHRVLVNRNVEDDVLTSYFSWIQTVPLFTSKETAYLLTHLIQVDKADSKFSKEEEEFVNTLARYLTYHARGIPRDIMRELQRVQHWSENRSSSATATSTSSNDKLQLDNRWLESSPQACIEYRIGQYPAIHAYAELQNSLEKLFDSPNPSNLVSTQTSSIATSTVNTEKKKKRWFAEKTPNADASSSFPLPIIDSFLTDNLSMTEYRWMNEERKEQVKRCLYIIVEELLDQGSMVLNSNEIFTRVHNNFTMFQLDDIELLLKRLASCLSDIRLKVGPSTPYPQYKSNTELQLFDLKSPEESLDKTSGFQKIAVLREFYSITGRSALVELSFKETSSLSLGKIEQYLKSGDNWQQQTAIDELKYEGNTHLKGVYGGSKGIYDQLCLLFLTSPNTELRSSIIGLQDKAFFDAVHSIGDNSLEKFVDTEIDEQLLQEFIRLMRVCTETDEKNNSIDGTNMLLRLLKRPKAMLPESLLIQAISTLAAIVTMLTDVDKDDILPRVVQSLHTNKDIPNVLLAPLKTLEVWSNQSLIELLVSHDFKDISLNTLQTLLESTEMLTLWNKMLTQKEKTIAQQVLIVLLQQSIQNLKLRKAVVAWLNDPTWDDTDRHILKAAQANSPGLTYTLQTEENINGSGQNKLTPEIYSDPIYSGDGYAAKVNSNNQNDIAGIIVVIVVILAIPIAIIIGAFVFHIIFLWWLIIGLVVGILASTVMRGGGYGVIGDIVVGIIGALAGGYLINHWITNIWSTCIAALMSACILIVLLRAVSRGSRRV